MITYQWYKLSTCLLMIRVGSAAWPRGVMNIWQSHNCTYIYPLASQNCVNISHSTADEFCSRCAEGGCKCSTNAQDFNCLCNKFGPSDNAINFETFTTSNSTSISWLEGIRTLETSRLSAYRMKTQINGGTPGPDLTIASFDKKSAWHNGLGDAQAFMSFSLLEVFEWESTLANQAFSPAIDTNRVTKSFSFRDLDKIGTQTRRKAHTNGSILTAHTTNKVAERAKIPNLKIEWEFDSVDVSQGSSETVYISNFPFSRPTDDTTRVSVSALLRSNWANKVEVLGNPSDSSVCQSFHMSSTNTRISDLSTISGLDSKCQVLLSLGNRSYTEAGLSQRVFFTFIAVDSESNLTTSMRLTTENPSPRPDPFLLLHALVGISVVLVVLAMTTVLLSLCWKNMVQPFDPALLDDIASNRQAHVMRNVVGDPRVTQKAQDSIYKTFV